MYKIQKFNEKDYESVIRFLEQCLPQSGRELELDGHHSAYCDIHHSFEHFWCLFDNQDIIGTVALRKIDTEKCELKSLYLLEEYQGKGLGYKLLKTAISKARESGFNNMVLDSISSSKKAISLYKRAGFIETERYNTNDTADVFMVLKLNQ